MKKHALGGSRHGDFLTVRGVIAEQPVVSRDGLNADAPLPGTVHQREVGHFNFLILQWLAIGILDTEHGTDAKTRQVI